MCSLCKSLMNISRSPPEPRPWPLSGTPLKRRGSRSRPRKPPPRPQERHILASNHGNRQFRGLRGDISDLTPCAGCAQNSQVMGECKHRWEEVTKRKRTFWRCRDCRDIFPCKHECTHFDCAEVKVERGELIDFPDYITVKVTTNAGDVIFDNIFEE